MLASKIKFHSSVIFVEDLEEMRFFYERVLMQKVTSDFETCISFEGGLSLWKLKESYLIAEKLGSTWQKAGNKNLELCFESEDFEEVVKGLAGFDLNYLHKVHEEPWGQRTVRFFDPENNLVELGESMACLIRRLYKSGQSVETICRKTSLPSDYVRFQIFHNGM